MIDRRFQRVAAQSGFTLVELLVVFAIGALLVGLMPMAYGRLQEAVQYRQTLSGFMTDLKTARQEARFSGAPKAFSVDLPNRRYGSMGGTTTPLPSPLEITAVVGSSELSQAQVATIWFMPDGGSTGGSFDIVRPSGGGTRVRVDWLSGRVEQERLPQ